LVVGRPFDLQVATPKRLETLHLVTDITAVNPAWLETLAPHLFQVKPGVVYFDPHTGTLATRTQLRFNGRTIEATGEPLTEDTPENQKQFIKLYAVWLHEQLEKERQTLQIINSRRIPIVPLRQVQNRVQHIAQGIVSLYQLPKKDRIELSKLAKIETYIGSSFMQRLNTSPDRSRHGRHHSHRPWKPQHKRKYDRRQGY
jgi:hypothetical protein